MTFNGNPHDNVHAAGPRSVDSYAHTYTDFWRGAQTRKCIFKSGPEWPVSLGPAASWKAIRLPRPVGRHPIAGTWRPIKDRIETCLDSLRIQWTSIDPLAFANEGERRPFCDLLIYITVSPDSLAYNDAVVASVAVKEILAKAGFPSIDNAFVESSVIPHTSRKLLSGVLDLDSDGDILKLEKPFSTVLGAPIAPLSQPHIRGSVGLILRLTGAETVLLTCSHVALPPVSEIVLGDSQGPREYIILDSKSYDASIAAMKDFIDSATSSIDAWVKRRDQTPDPETKAHFSKLISTAENNIRHVKALKVNVAESFSTPDQRVVGSLLHAEHVSNDWASVKVYGDRIGSDFVGNKLFLGHRKECQRWYKLMFPEAASVSDMRRHPEDGYLKVSGVVPRSDFEDPPHVDHNGDRCLIVVKNGATSDITIGRANSLESSTRIYGSNHDDMHTSHKIAVIPHECEKGAFSEPGDSGSVVLDRDGRIVGLLTSGNGLADTTDWSYITPFWLLQSQIKARFGDFTLYSSDD